MNALKSTHGLNVGIEVILRRMQVRRKKLEMENIEDSGSRTDRSKSNPTSPHRHRSRSRTEIRARSDSKSVADELSIRKRLRTTRRQSDVVMQDDSTDILSLRSEIEILKSQISSIEEDHMELSRLMGTEESSLSYLEITPVRE